LLNFKNSLEITGHEAGFLWSFIQGGMMNETTWGQLMDAWGFCERHAWIYLNVEMTFRHRYLRTATILYTALIEQALSVSQARNVRPKLRSKAPCIICARNSSAAGTSPRQLKRFSQVMESHMFCDFATELEPVWRKKVCSICAGQAGAYRCRPHLLSDTKTGKVHSDLQWADLENLHKSLERYGKSFGQHGTNAHPQDAAALVTAIGWCSGWKPLLSFVGRE